MPTPFTIGYNAIYNFVVDVALGTAANDLLTFRITDTTALPVTTTVLSNMPVPDGTAASIGEIAHGGTFPSAANANGDPNRLRD
jgi:hypothetical protein